MEPVELKGISLLMIVAVGFPMLVGIPRLIQSRLTVLGRKKLLRNTFSQVVHNLLYTTFVRVM